MNNWTFTLLVTLAVFASPLTPLAFAEDKVTYDDHVKPILRGACFKCHNPDKTKGDLDLSTYTALMLGGGSGPVVEAGDPDTSFLYTVMTHAEEPTMPPDSPPRPEKELLVIKNWIAGGLLENKSSKAKISAKPKLDLAMSESATAKPEGPPPMPVDHLLQPVVRADRSTAVTALAASPWAPVVALGGQRQILLYNTDTLQLASVLPFMEGFPESLRFSVNGKLLLAGGGVGASLGTTVLYDVKTGDRLTQIGEDFDSILASDISGDQKYIATGGPDKYLNLYTIADGAQVHHIKKHTDWVTAVAFSPDAVLVASGDRNGNLHVWETDSGQLFYDLRGHKGKITSISWRRDSNVLVSASEDGSIRVWSPHNGKQIRSWTAHGGGVLDAAFAMNGKLVSTGRDKTPKLWNLEGKQERAFPKTTDLPTSVAISHDNKRVIAGDWEGKVHVWNAADAKPLGTLDANPPTIEERLATIDKQIAAKQKAAADAAAAANAQAEKAKADVAAKQKALAAREAELKTLQAQQAEAQKAADALTPAVQNAEKALAAARQSVDATAKKRGPAEQAKAKLLADRAAAQAAHDEAIKQVSALETKHKAAKVEAEKAGALKLVAEMKTVLEKLRKEVEAFAPQVAEADKSLSAIDAESAAKNTAVQNAEKALNDQKKKQVDAQAKVNGIGAPIAEKAKAVEAAKKAVADAQAKTKAAPTKPADTSGLQKQKQFWKAAQYNQSVFIARQDMREKQNIIAALEAELEAAKAAAKSSSDQYNAKKAEYEKLKGK